MKKAKIYIQNMKTSIALFASLLSASDAFAPNAGITNRLNMELYSTAVEIEPKEAVKVFGRLAEKYIMLDDSGGLCCYSACSDCEFRLPGGGYKMADQSSARPKWIPSYPERKFESMDKEHITAWSTQIFTDGPMVTKEQFVERVKEMKFNPPLGGPYMSASAAGIEDESTIERLFDVLTGEKENLTQHRMSTRIKEIAKGNEGLIWSDFIAAMTGEE